MKHAHEHSQSVRVRASDARFRIAQAVALGLMLPAVLVAQAPEPESTCWPESADQKVFSPELYCLDLVPTPDLRSASGVVQLGHVASPFAVSVSADGTQQYDLTLDARNLPDPATLGAYETYVAWATTPLLRPMVKLGEVGNGRYHLGRVAFNKFLIMISAEASPDVTERSGRLVLRGTSPSMRMVPDQHGILIADAGPGTAQGAAGMAHGGGWRMPPSHPSVQMMPGMAGLMPSVAPFMPDTTGRLVVDARPRELLVLQDGDSIDLEANIVRRQFMGHPLAMYGFNGQYPGPLISVPQGATVVVNFTNAIDLPSTVHWHGLRLDNRFDGVPDVTQDEVQPGESFRYEVFFPDAGVYWYHPHVREDIQQDLGLYGNMFVRPSDSTYFNPVNREEFLIVDDLLMDDGGILPYGRENETHALMGRFGNVSLVNGVPDHTIEVNRGDVVRFFLTNVANTRTYNLAFDGARMKLVGSDLGRYEREEWVESIVIAPAERYIVEVLFDRTGDVALINRVQGLDHFFGAFFAEEDTLAAVTVRNGTPSQDHSRVFDRLRTNREVTADLERARSKLDAPPDHELILRLETDGLPFAIDWMMRMDSAYFTPVEWSGTMRMMNWASTGREVQWLLRDVATGLVNMDIAWRFAVGDLVKIRLTNDKQSLHAMQHPIHFHGQRFAVLAVGGVPNQNLVWKDTVLVPVGTTVDILLEISNPGRWMVHCHIAEHLGSGMMMVFEAQ